MRLGVFTDALAHLSLGEVLDWIELSVPDVRDVELGTGGYSNAPHCDVAELLSAAGAGLGRRARVRQDVHDQNRC